LTGAVGGQIVDSFVHRVGTQDSGIRPVCERKSGGKGKRAQLDSFAKEEGLPPLTGFSVYLLKSLPASLETMASRWSNRLVKNGFPRTRP
jgi:hypothetical protein